MSKTVSIITVNLNDAQGLEKTIKSVIGQTYTDFEFIIIDGASTDGSVSVIEKYASQIDIWVSEPDSGIFNAMNKGIKRASGKYCYFLNANDILTSNTVFEQIFKEKEYAAPYICGNQINDFGNGDTGIVKNAGRPLTLYDFYWGTIKHQATFIRRDMFALYGLYDENLRIISDWKFFLQTIGLKNEQPVYVDTDIVIFAWFGMSTDKKMQEKHDIEREQVLKALIPPTVRKDMEQLHYLKNYEYIAQSMKKNKIVDAIIRFIIKLF
ncbi:glycosyltransferase involved in cell wall biosynthesis [Dysgonomonas sp. PH5-45]|uniref:glycosyltransferase family 2 protein n=1 Tax=unclassified Dysgonomonas TaxID=2630389 RepID=UPI0024770801|nr:MULTISPECIES: glycosyltransferase family 2 protein [unclassified Dysgonomonas]MDH6353798.1 glycosyltransferase involved in cell wall biosynthesis [Dysgonomonas sp. PH5-45]MDH6386700.1 glycosyltransferase involved in cell wall biosynthesis [Dysgonomonas sp. PH5-37]